MACVFIIFVTIALNNAFRTWKPPPSRENAKRQRHDLTQRRLNNSHCIYENAATCFLVAAFDLFFSIF
jgi:hypothetical protein